MSINPSTETMLREQRRQQRLAEAERKPSTPSQLETQTNDLGQAVLTSMVSPRAFGIEPVSSSRITTPATSGEEGLREQRRQQRLAAAERKPSTSSQLETQTSGLELTGLTSNVVLPRTSGIESVSSSRSIAPTANVQKITNSKVEARPLEMILIFHSYTTEYERMKDYLANHLNITFTIINIVGGNPEFPKDSKTYAGAIYIQKDLGNGGRPCFNEVARNLHLIGPKCNHNTIHVFFHTGIGTTESTPSDDLEVQVDKSTYLRMPFPSGVSLNKVKAQRVSYNFPLPESIEAPIPELYTSILDGHGREMSLVGLLKKIREEADKKR